MGCDANRGYIQPHLTRIFRAETCYDHTFFELNGRAIASPGLLSHLFANGEPALLKSEPDKLTTLSWVKK